MSNSPPPANAVWKPALAVLALMALLIGYKVIRWEKLAGVIGLDIGHASPEYREAPPVTHTKEDY